MRIGTLAKVAAAPLVLYGCVARPIAVVPEPPREAPRGSIVARPGRAGVVVGAPQGTDETGTGDIAAAVAQRAGAGLVVASRVSIDEYERVVRETARGPLVFYVEIRGTARQAPGDRIEIATVGVDREHAVQLRTLFELIRDAHLHGRAGVPRLSLLIAPADPAIAPVGAAKPDGVLRFPERVLHVDLPRPARQDSYDVYAAIVADFVAEAISLRPFR
jgi:hypothetical protein